uniref:Odorant receptor n=1 Tax=Heliconius melpomene rosina TaxID=171916 RepID=A0A1S5XXL5_HELME|nr:olfactory receptor 8 [Heliconius melpomene rosina]
MSPSTKRLLTFFCKYVYYAGAGDFLCNGVKESKIYRIYTLISFSVYFIMIFLENLAALIGDFPEVEGKSAVMFSAIHDIILIKMFLIFYYKSSIIKLNNEMALVMSDIEEESVIKRQQNKVLWGIGLYVLTVYLSLISYGVESLRKVIVEGTPFYTVVTYFPSYYDNSFMASTFRVFFYMTWLYMMLPMIAADCMPIVHLIIMAYKFVTLCNYYDRIRRNFYNNLKIMNNQSAARILKLQCLRGILLHQKLMFLAEEIHRIFGIIMSLQVCESSAVAVLLLLRLALSPHMNLTNAFMTYTFVGSLFFLLALNLWNAGEITYQASLLSNAMFYCGWHVCEMEPTHNDIRCIILIGCAQAQKPLILKAFGIQDLSYSTFVSVARMTYSVFAVFYQRRT